MALTRKVLVKRTEVTQAEWRQLIPHNPALFTECGTNCPVERVNWYEALTWLNRLSEAEGLDTCYELTECTGQSHFLGAIFFIGHDLEVAQKLGGEGLMDFKEVEI